VLSVIFAVITLVFSLIIENQDTDEIANVLLKREYFIVLIPFSLVLDVKNYLIKFILIFFSFMFEKIYKYDLTSYIVV
jgi:hypothetical protein